MPYLNQLFLLVSTLLLISTFLVIVSNHPIFSLLFLVASFISSSVLLIFLECEFLALLFIIVYVGAISVLFLFAVMMLEFKLSTLSKNSIKYFPVGFVFGAAFLIPLLKNINIFFDRNGTFLRGLRWPASHFQQRNALFLPRSLLRVEDGTKPIDWEYDFTNYLFPEQDIKYPHYIIETDLLSKAYIKSSDKSDKNSIDLELRDSLLDLFYFKDENGIRGLDHFIVWRSIKEVQELDLRSIKRMEDKGWCEKGCENFSAFCPEKNGILKKNLEGPIKIEWKGHKNFCTKGCEGNSYLDYYLTWCLEKEAKESGSENPIDEKDSFEHLMELISDPRDGYIMSHKFHPDPHQLEDSVILGGPTPVTDAYEIYFILRSCLKTRSFEPVNWFDLVDSATTIEAYGEVLYSYFIFQFLLAGLILLVVLIGVVYLTNNTQTKVKDAAIFSQLSRASPFPKKL